jgi:hypothetical protein
LILAVKGVFVKPVSHHTSSYCWVIALQVGNLILDLENILEFQGKGSIPGKRSLTVPHLATARTPSLPEGHRDGVAGGARGAPDTPAHYNGGIPMINAQK